MLLDDECSLFKLISSLPTVTSWPSLDLHLFIVSLKLVLQYATNFSSFHRRVSSSFSHRAPHTISTLNMYISFLASTNCTFLHLLPFFKLLFGLIFAWNLRIIVAKLIEIFFYNLSIIFGTSEMRRLYQTSNLSRILDCFTSRFDGVCNSLRTKMMKLKKF